MLTAGDLEDRKKTDQDLFMRFLVQYNDADKLSYASHAFEQVDDFVNAANFSPFPTTEWENARRRFAELMAEYGKLRNRRSGFHSNFAERMAEEMKTSSTHTYPLMLYLHMFLEKDESILTLACPIFHLMFSVSPHLELLVLLHQRRVGADTNSRVEKVVVAKPQWRLACRARY